MKKRYSIKKIEELILHEGVRIAMIDGGRGIGKSYQVKTRAIKNAYKDDNNKFIYMRRYAEDLKNFYVEKYFSQPAIIAYIKRISKNEYTNIFCANHTLYFGKFDSEYKKVLGKKCGYCIPLSQDTRHKSLDFEDVQSIIFEEWQTEETYLQREPDRLLSILSTVARDREDVAVFMIANLINTVSPYAVEFALDRIERQKAGTIDIYDEEIELSGGGIYKFKVAREFCEEVSILHNKDKEVSYYKTGNHTTYKILNSDKVYHELVIEYGQFKFLCRLIKVNNCFVWHVERKTSDIRKNTRIISNKFYYSNLYTNALIPISNRERKAIELMTQGKIVYSDRITAEKFLAVLKNF